MEAVSVIAGIVIIAVIYLAIKTKKDALKREIDNGDVVPPPPPEEIKLPLVQEFLGTKLPDDFVEKVNEYNDKNKPGS